MSSLLLLMVMMMIIIVIIIIYKIHSVLLLISLYTSISHPSQCQSTLYNLQSPVSTYSSHSAVPSCQCPAGHCAATVDVWSQQWESRNFRTRCQKFSIFMVRRNPGHLAFRTEFCGTPGQNSSTPINPGLSRENEEKSHPLRQSFACSTGLTKLAISSSANLN